MTRTHTDRIDRKTELADRWAGRIGRQAGRMGREVELAGNVLAHAHTHADKLVHTSCTAKNIHTRAKK